MKKIISLIMAGCVLSSSLVYATNDFKVIGKVGLTVVDSIDIGSLPYDNVDASTNQSKPTEPDKDTSSGSGSTGDSSSGSSSGGSSSGSSSGSGSSGGTSSNRRPSGSSGSSKGTSTNIVIAPANNADMKYTDVAKEDWFHDSVSFALENGLMNGVSNNSFAPHDKITRAMFVTVLYRMEKEPAVATHSFTDVEKGSWYENAVAWASANKIVNGVDEGVFAPDSSITREQMAAIIYRYAGSKEATIEPDSTLTYTDASSISPFAEEAIKWASGAKIMSGNADGSFAPQSGATRAEAATVFMRVFNLGK